MSITPEVVSDLRQHVGEKIALRYDIHTFQGTLSEVEDGRVLLELDDEDREAMVSNAERLYCSTYGIADWHVVTETMKE